MQTKTTLADVQSAKVRGFGLRALCALVREDNARSEVRIGEPGSNARMEAYQRWYEQQSGVNPPQSAFE